MKTARSLHVILFLLVLFQAQISQAQVLNLLSTTPDQNSIDVARNSTITLTFDQNIEGSTIQGNILVWGNQTAAIPGTFTGQGTSTITFTPSSDFKPGEVITVLITDNVRAVGTNDALASPYSHQFTSAIDASPESAPFFRQKSISTSADEAFKVHIADIDGDGDLDILSASTADDKIAWYENTDGQGGFSSEKVITLLADGARSVFAADLDGDGDADVLSGSEFDDKVAWYENTDGLGNFGSQMVISTAGDGVRDVHAVDMDGDGDLDVVAASANDDEISWYENTNGLGSFGSQMVITSAREYPLEIHTADIDGDGDMDVLIAASDSDYIVWQENLNGTFSDHNISTSTDGASSVFPADLDGDGDLDVVTSGYHDGKISWHKNTDGVGNFGPRLDISSATVFARIVRAVDLDGDGDLDVISASEGDDKLAWYENTDGQGAFSSQKVITSDFDGAMSIQSGDIDGDNDIDLVAGAYYDDEIAWYDNTFAPDIKVAADQLELVSGVGTFDLGDVYVNYSATYYFLIENIGTGDLTLNPAGAIDIGGTDPGEFTSAAFLDGEVLSTDEMVALDIMVNPSSPGVKSIVITVHSDDPDESSYSFTVTANAIPFPSACTPTAGDMENSYKGSALQGFLGGVTGVSEFEAPTGWIPVLSQFLALFGSQVNVSMTADAHSGSKAVELTSDATGIGDIITTFSCNVRPAKLKGFYKFSGAPTDSAMVVVSSALSSDRNETNTDTLYIKADASVYTMFMMDILYDQHSTDDILIHIFTTANGSSTTLKVDDLEVVAGGPSLSYATRGDLSTIVLDEYIPLWNPTVNAATGITFDRDGNTVFVVDGGADQVLAFDLAAPYSFTTTQLSGALDVSSEDITPSGIDFGNDGTKLYLVGFQGSIHEYSLSVAYDLSTASLENSFLVTVQDTGPSALAVSNDGTKIFISGTFSDAIFEYSLSTPFDISSASFTTSFSVSSEESDPREVRFNANGTMMYVSGSAGNIHEYMLGTPFDVSTAIFNYTSSVSFGHFGFQFNNSFTKLFAVSGGGVQLHSLSSFAYREAAANDGSLEGEILISISEDTFEPGQLISPDQYEFINLPFGLSPQVTVSIDQKTAVVKLNGNALLNESDIENLHITFKDGAFTNSSAHEVGYATGPVNTTLGIDFEAGSSVNFPPSPPDKPSFGSITTSSIVVNWQAPDLDGGSAITSYTLERNNGSGFEEVFTGNVLTFTDTNLEANFLYTYRVVATNGEGSSDPSAEASQSTSSGPPLAPAAPSIGEVEANSIVVNWSPPSNDGGSPITEYVLEINDGSGFTEVFSGDALTYTASGLESSTVHVFRVKAVNSLGESPFSAETTATTSVQVDLTPPVVETLTPGNSATEVLVSSNLVLDFDEPIAVADGTITIYNSADDSVVEVISLSSASSVVSNDIVTIDPVNNLPYESTIYIEISPGTFQDLAGNEYGGISGNTTWSFTTEDKLSQTITFDIGDKNEDDLPFQLTASATSGLPVSFTLVSGPASLTGNEVALNGPGQITILASQSGNFQYAAAEEVEDTFCALPKTPTISVSQQSGNSVILTSSSSQGNSWFLDGSLMTLTTNEITATQPGEYTVQVSIDGCVSSLSDPQSVTITGIQELLSVIELYPNPAKEKLTLLLPGDWIGETLKLRIFSTTGHQIQFLHLKQKNEKFELDISELQSGFYNLVLYQNEWVKQLKFVKE